MLLHAPATSLTALLSLYEERLSIFIFATLMSWSSVISPALSSLGFFAPLWILISFFMSALVGGLPTSISKDFVAESTITFTGTLIPEKSFVFSFIFATTSPIFTPMGPNAGPKGAPAEAFPPSTKTLISGIKISFLFQLLLNHSYVFSAYCDRNLHSCFKQFNCNLFLCVVNPDYLCLFSLERACNKLNFLPCLDALHEWL